MFGLIHGTITEIYDFSRSTF